MASCRCRRRCSSVAAAAVALFLTACGPRPESVEATPEAKSSAKPPGKPAALALALTANAPKRQPNRYDALLTSLLPTLASEDAKKRTDARRKLDEAAFLAGRPGAAAERSALCEAICYRLDFTLAMPKPARVWLIKQLERIGRSESVATLSRLLAEKDERIRDPARRALQNNPSPHAGRQLSQALTRAGNPAWQVALINSLGYRRYKEGVGALIIQAKRGRPDAVRVAAYAALGKIGDKTAIPALEAGMKRGAPRSRARRVATDSFLLLADRLAEQGNKQVALDMYRQLLSKSGHIKCAAIIGLGRAGGTRELPTIFDALADDDAKIRGAAMSALTLVPVNVLVQAVRKQKNASPEFVAGLLRVLGRRGDRSTRDIFIQAASDQSEVVRVVALTALARVGDASAVPLLARAIVKGTRPEQQAARRSLYRLSGPGVNRAIISSAASEQFEIKARVELIRSLKTRNARDAVPGLLTLASGPDAPARLEAFKALAALAAGNDAPALVKLLVNIRGSSERRVAENAVVAACKRRTQERAAPVLAALPGAAGSARVSLLKVLGRIGGAKSLAAVRDLLKHGSTAIRDAAIRALTDWPDPEPMPDLLALAKGADQEVHRVLALWGYVRMIGLAGEDGPRETTRVSEYERAWQVAWRDEQRKLILAGLSDVNDIAALSMAERFLDNEALAAEAAAAITKIAGAVSGQHREAAKRALRKVIAASQNERLRIDATVAIAQIEKYDDYITAWMLSGPYTRKGKRGPKLFKISFPPEQPEAREQAKWRLVPAGVNRDKPWMVDLKKIIGGDHRAAYLRTNIWSPKNQSAQLELGSDDGLKVWLNGKLVHERNRERGLKPGEDKVKIRLRKGWNRLLLKINQGKGDWAACARLRTRKGRKLSGLRYQAQRK